MLTISLSQVLKQHKALSSQSSISKKQAGENSLKAQPISTEIGVYFGCGWPDMLRYKYLKQNKPQVIIFWPVLPHMLALIKVSQEMLSRCSIDW